MNCWWSGFKDYLNKYDLTLHNVIANSTAFSWHLSKFLFTKDGAKYQEDFKFHGELICNEKAPDILVSSSY